MQEESTWNRRAGVHFLFVETIRETNHKGGKAHDIVSSRTVLPLTGSGRQRRRFLSCQVLGGAKDKTARGNL